MLHAIFDFIVDGYLPDRQRRGSRRYSRPSKHARRLLLEREEIGRLLTLRRRGRLIRFQRVLWGRCNEGSKYHASPASGLLRPRRAWPYFQDVLDHVRRVETRVGGLREILTSVFEAANLLEQQRQGVITRQRLPLACCDPAVPTAIAGYLRHEFRQYARVEDGLWLFHRPRRHRAAVLRAVRPVQEGEVALDSEEAANLATKSP